VCQQSSAAREEPVRGHPRGEGHELPVGRLDGEVYRGRIELESLATATRATLEANGWRHISTTKTSQHGINQVYEKGGTSLQVLLWENWIFTYAEYTTARVLQAPR